MRTVLLVSAFLLVTAIATAQTPRPSGGYLPRNLTFESCEEMHDSYLKRFVSAEGAGLTRMMTPALLDTSSTLELGKTRYGIETIELVGLLKNSTPVVYGPRMHSIGPPQRTANRAPDAFEVSALAGFSRGKDIVSRNDANALRCIGAVRAVKECVQCHEDKKPGDLLGAFTYRLKSLSK
jgi:hypothetical protein